jgi:hypothetical protein
MVEGERAKEGTISGFKARPLNPVLKASKAINVVKKGRNGQVQCLWVRLVANVIKLFWCNSGH